MNGALAKWTARSSTGQHFECLDGLRGMAIIMVVAYHTVYCNPRAAPAIIAGTQLCGAGWMGVPLFFVLSGFLISYPMFLKRFQCKQDILPRNYVLKRASKIIPPFYLSLIIFALAYYLWQRRLDAPRIALHYALGLPNFFREKAEFNGVYWSLIVEAHFYILLPLLFLLFRRLAYSKLGPLIFSLFLLLPPIARCLAWKPAVGPGETRFLMARFPGALDFFSWGILFAWLLAGNLLSAWPRPRLARLGYLGLALLAALMAAWGALDYSRHVSETQSLLTFNFFETALGVAGFLLLFFVYDPAQAGARLFSSPALRLAGIVSYEWFLFHWPVVHWTRQTLGPASGSLLRYATIVLAPVLLTFIFSTLLYRYFSLPIMQKLR